uniref:Uncharacterized protein n=1 Tax=Lepeophtheirus salmonis TaxID=72036 RepID=A0A0K2V6X4_LEPSM
MNCLHQKCSVELVCSSKKDLIYADENRTHYILNSFFDVMDRGGLKRPTDVIT